MTAVIACAMRNEHGAFTPVEAGWTRIGNQGGFHQWRDPSGRLWSVQPMQRLVVLSRPSRSGRS